MPRRRGPTAALDAWPGYVDALSTLLMVITFVLLVFVLAQAFLSVSLSNKDTQLEALDRQIAQLTDLLSLEKGHSADLAAAVASLNKAVQSAEAQRDDLRRQLAAAAIATGADRQTAQALRDQNAVVAAELSDAQIEAKSAAARMQSLQSTADGATASADKINASAAEIALLNQQVAQLRLQLAAISADLNLATASDAQKAAQITDLTARLNLALAHKVEELQQYRSEFFGRLKQVLKGRPGITIVGDRFVFQSEVLFPVGSAEMSPAGRTQIRTLAKTLLEIGGTIPKTLPWIMRIDGHADHQPLTGAGRFASNWELSAERAINVVRFLISQGVPPSRLAATAFADSQPLAAGDSQADYAKNRRIELRLTDR